jgi:hypothetical protein
MREPSAEFTRRYPAAQAKLCFSISAVGSTANQRPEGFVVDHTRIKLGFCSDAHLTHRSYNRRRACLPRNSVPRDSARIANRGTVPDEPTTNGPPRTPGPSFPNSAAGC